MPVRDWRVLEDAVLRAEGTNLIQLDRECVDLLRSMVAEKTEGMDPVKENKSQLLSLGRRWVKVNRGRFRYKDITYGDVIQKRYDKDDRNMFSLLLLFLLAVWEAKLEAGSFFSIS